MYQSGHYARSVAARPHCGGVPSGEGASAYSRGVVIGKQDAGVDDLEDMDELDLAEVEREICRLPDVSIARLVAEPTGRVSEVHVVAHPGKHPKQIARDVQSIALASFGLELDRHIISVGQLGGDMLDPQVLRAHARPPVRPTTA